MKAFLAFSVATFASLSSFGQTVQTIPAPSTPIPKGPVITQKMPASVAGTITTPTGKIAFLREKSVWMMEASGANKTLVCDAKNAEGRLSWSPDNRQIMFTRSGNLQLQRPDGTGGFRKLYGLFIAFIDSAKATPPNTFYWNRITDDLGVRDPEWHSDGRVLLCKDMVANDADLPKPNFQAATMSSDGTDVQLFRKDWQNMKESFLQPSMNSRGDLAFAHFVDLKPFGIAILSKDRYMLRVDSIRAISAKLAGYVSPGWSPDSKWLAFVGNNANNSGVYVASPDLQSKYLVYTPPPGTSINTNSPSFSPDSKWLTFSTSDGSIWICDITGNGAKRIAGPGVDVNPAWSH